MATQAAISLLDLEDFDFSNQTSLGTGASAEVLTALYREAPDGKVAVKIPFRKDPDGPMESEEVKSLATTGLCVICKSTGLIRFLSIFLCSWKSDCD